MSYFWLKYFQLGALKATLYCKKAIYESSLKEYAFIKVPKDLALSLINFSKSFWKANANKSPIKDNTCKNKNDLAKFLIYNIEKIYIILF